MPQRISEELEVSQLPSGCGATLSGDLLGALAVAIARQSHSKLNSKQCPFDAGMCYFLPIFPKRTG